MPEAAADLLTTLQRQEDDLVLDSFDHTDAWILGAGMVELAQSAGHARRHRHPTTGPDPVPRRAARDHG